MSGFGQVGGTQRLIGTKARGGARKPDGVDDAGYRAGFGLGPPLYGEIGTP